MLDKQKFLEILKNDVKVRYSTLGATEHAYAVDKGTKIIDLLIELESGGLLKCLNPTKVKEIRSELENLMFNFEHIKKVYLTYIKLVENNKMGAPKTEIILRDDLGNEYKITMNQIVMSLATLYCSICEVMRQYLTHIIDFKKLGKVPTGIGDAIRLLRDNKIKNLLFFDDLDSEVRNSFSHLDFKFKIEGTECRIYYRNSPKDNYSKYILLQDLLMLAIHADRSTYALMHGCGYYLSKYATPPPVPMPAISLPPKVQFKRLNYYNN